MNRARKILTGAAERLDLPAEVLAGIPKMELTGFRQFSIEPHKGLVEYEKERISIESELGQILILGSELTIQLMNRQRITIRGKLSAVELEKEHHG